MACFHYRAFSQEERFTIRSGAGYYMDVFTTDDGPIIWLEGGYKLNTGFNLNARVSMASLDWKIREGTFEGYTTILLRQMADLTFSKPFKLKGQNFLEPGVGFKLKKEYFLKPDIENIYSGGYLLSGYKLQRYLLGNRFHYLSRLLLSVPE